MKLARNEMLSCMRLPSVPLTSSTWFSGYAVGTLAMRRKGLKATAYDPSANVVVLRPRITARHQAYLMKWLKAGQQMGLLDVAVASQQRLETGEDTDHVLVWVRENADPAYRLKSDGMHWVVMDELRETPLKRCRNFEEALEFIRPVLRTPPPIAADASWQSPPDNQNADQSLTAV